MTIYLGDMKSINTLGDARSQKHNSEARAEVNARIDAARKANIANTLKAYPQIGQLASGKFYAYVGTAKTYVESRFLNAVVDAINEVK